MNKILRLAAILLCSMPAAACGDGGGDLQPAKPVVPSAIPSTSALDKAVLGKWQELAGTIDDQEFGDVTVTPNRLTFEKKSAAQIIVHQNYVSLKWEDKSKAPICVGGANPMAATILPFEYGMHNRPGVEIIFYDKDRPPAADSGTDLNVCKNVNWARPLSQSELNEYNRAIGKTK